jgi:hypothetical protein
MYNRRDNVIKISINQEKYLTLQEMKMMRKLKRSPKKSSRSQKKRNKKRNKNRRRFPT